MTPQRMRELIEFRGDSSPYGRGGAWALGKMLDDRKAKAEIMAVLWSHGGPYPLGDGTDVHINGDGDGYLVIDRQTGRPSFAVYSYTGQCEVTTWDYSRPARKPA